MKKLLVALLVAITITSCIPAVMSTQYADISCPCVITRVEDTRVEIMDIYSNSARIALRYYYKEKTYNLGDTVDFVQLKLIKQ